MEIKIPQNARTDMKALGEFIIRLNEEKAKVALIDKSIEVALKEAKELMLENLEQSGQKHFAFEGLGTFSKSTKTQCSFPTEEMGGRTAAVNWLMLCVERGIIDIPQLLYIQQARLVPESVMIVEQAVAEYNQQQMEAGNWDLIPESPFSKYEVKTLSAPRSRKV